MRYWLPPERLGLMKSGELPSMAASAVFTIFVGPTCSGKTEYTDFAVSEFGYLPIKKCRYSDLRPEEDAGKVPAQSLDFRSWLSQTNNNFLSSIIVGFDPPYDEWEYWKAKFGLYHTPTHKELMQPDIFERFVMVYHVSDIVEACERASDEGRGIALGLFPQHAHSWKQLFPKTRIIQLSVDPFVLKDRINERWGLNNTEPLARLLDGASTWPYFFPEDPTFPNNTRQEMSQNMEVLKRTLEDPKGPITGPLKFQILL